jgi:hypothetical protein
MSFLQNQRRNKTARSLAFETLDRRELMAADMVVPRVVNGTVTGSYPNVGMVGDTVAFDGTGTLISPRHVLTAAHAVEGMSNTDARFRLGSTTYQSSKVIPFPYYSQATFGTSTANDIAIIELNQEVAGIAPAVYSRYAPRVGEVQTLVGFGAAGTGSGHDGTYGTKRVGTTPIEQVHASLIRWRFDDNTESNTAPGDSGGPAFTTRNGNTRIAGVISGGTKPNSSLGDQSYNTRVDVYAAWIDSIVQNTQPVRVSIEAFDKLAAEAETGTPDKGVFRISRTGSTSRSLQIRVLLNGTATFNGDYSTSGFTKSTSTVTIPSGRSFIDVTITTKNDARAEGPETVDMTLLAKGNYAFTGDAVRARVTITDDDNVVPPNDNFANAIALRGFTSTTSNNVLATSEENEPNPGNVSSSLSVWWNWTATTTGSVTIDTRGSLLDTTLGVYSGNAVDSLTLVAENDDEDRDALLNTSLVRFNAVAGRVYRIQVNGYRFLGGGDIILTIAAG